MSNISTPITNAYQYPHFENKGAFSSSAILSDIKECTILDVRCTISNFHIFITVSITLILKPYKSHKSFQIPVQTLSFLLPETSNAINNPNIRPINNPTVTCLINFPITNPRIIVTIKAISLLFIPVRITIQELRNTISYFQSFFLIVNFTFHH